MQAYFKIQALNSRNKNLPWIVTSLCEEVLNNFPWCKLGLSQIVFPATWFPVEEVRTNKSFGSPLGGIRFHLVLEFFFLLGCGLHSWGHEEPSESTISGYKYLLCINCLFLVKSLSAKILISFCYKLRLSDGLHFIPCGFRWHKFERIYEQVTEYFLGGAVLRFLHPYMLFRMHSLKTSLKFVFLLRYCVGVGIFVMFLLGNWCFSRCISLSPFFTKISEW